MQLFYQVQGQGPALVLLHGFLEDHSIWNSMVDALSKEYTLLLVDLPGHGRSTLGSEVFHMEAVAEAVLQLTTALSFEKIQVLGHSMGGYVALAMTELSPNGITAIYLLNSTTEADTPERRIERDRAHAALASRPQIFIRMAIANLFPLNRQSSYQDTIRQLSKKAQTFSVAGVQAAVLGMKLRLDRSAVLASFRGKKIIWSGERDPLLDIQKVRNVAQNTHSQFITLSGGHMGWIENKDEVVKRLLFNE